MDKKDLKELYEIYSQARSTNLFSKFLFNRKMNSREVKSVLEKMQVYFEIHGERLDEKDIIFSNYEKWMFLGYSWKKRENKWKNVKKLFGKNS